MKLMKRVLSGTSAAVLSLSSLLTLGFSGVAHAAVQTCTWTGTGGDNKFSTAANWSNCGGGVPQAGDVVVINATAVTSGHDKLVNDLTVDLGGVETNYDVPSGQSSATSGVWISQLSIADGGYVSTLSSANGKYDLFIGDGTTLGKIIGKGSLELRGYSPFTKYDVTGVLKIAQVATDDFVYVTILSDSHAGSIDIAGKGEVIFGSQTKDITTITSSIPITVEAGANAGLYFWSACAEFAMMGTQLKTTCLQTQPTTVNYSGALTLNASTTFSSDADTTVNMAGQVIGASNLSRTSGSGVLNIGSKSVVTPAKTTNYADAKDTETINVVENETAVMSKDAVRSSVMVESGGLLKGLGTFKHSLWVSAGGTVAPGMSPGCLTSDTLVLTGMYQFELGGTDPCSGYDQLIVMNASSATTAVTLNATTSVLSTSRYNGHTPKQGQSFTIIDQAGSAAVTGTFKGLPEGATFTQNGVVFKISYVGGTGNDVVITVQNQPTAPDTGFALISANPLVTLGATASAALVLLAMARKTRPAHAHAHASRRRK